MWYENVLKQGQLENPAYISTQGIDSWWVTYPLPPPQQNIILYQLKTGCASLPLPPLKKKTGIGPTWVPRINTLPLLQRMFTHLHVGQYHATWLSGSSNTVANFLYRFCNSCCIFCMLSYQLYCCRNYILFYCIIFYYIMFYSILFYSILFYSILFYSILFYSIQLHPIPFYYILLSSILFYSILFTDIGPVSPWNTWSL